MPAVSVSANYRRLDLTEGVRPAPGAAWTFVGRPDAGERLREGLERGHAVIRRDYLERVSTGFRCLGAGEWRRYAASTEPPTCPVRDLRRVEVPRH